MEDRGRREGWSGNVLDWSAILRKFQQSQWGILNAKLPITGLPCLPGWPYLPVLVDSVTAWEPPTGSVAPEILW